MSGSCGALEERFPANLGLWESREAHDAVGIAVRRERGDRELLGAHDRDGDGAGEHAAGAGCGPWGGRGGGREGHQRARLAVQRAAAPRRKEGAPARAKRRREELVAQRAHETAPLDLRIHVHRDAAGVREMGEGMCAVCCCGF